MGVTKEEIVLAEKARKFGCVIERYHHNPALFFVLVRRGGSTLQTIYSLHTGQNLMLLNAEMLHKVFDQYAEELEETVRRATVGMTYDKKENMWAWADVYDVWTCDSGQANVPKTVKGAQWIKRADEIMSLPDSEVTGNEWDEHSQELRRIGGFWS